MGTVQKTEYGKLPDGSVVHQFILKNEKGTELRCIEYGATITHWIVPDKHGTLSDIVLGYDSLENYLAGDSYLGAVVGRFANRIEKSSFKIDGETYQIPKNEGSNNLHGGPGGFDTKHWKGTKNPQQNDASVKFSLLSPDGDQGFPGDLKIAVTFTLSDDDELMIEYEATSSKTTVINITQHAYFNLSNKLESISNHQLFIDADQFVPIDSQAIPLAEFARVENTPFDFRNAKKIGHQINQEHPQIEVGTGFDHSFVLNKPGISTLSASVFEPSSGRKLEVITTEPGIQFYSGNHLNDNVSGKNNTTYFSRCGFCLETQHFPNSPNRPDFPSVLLYPDDVFSSKTKYTLSVEK